MYLSLKLQNRVTQLTNYSSLGGLNLVNLSLKLESSLVTGSNQWLFLS